MREDEDDLERLARKQQERRQQRQGEPPEPEPGDPGAQPPPKDDELDGEQQQQQQQQPPPKSAPLFDPWARNKMPEFPLDVLPYDFQRWVIAQNKVTGCDISAVAMTMLTAVSAAIHHRCAVKMLRGGSWWASPRLWTLLVGDPSYQKTPAINAATEPLERHQHSLRRDYQAQLRDYKLAKALAKKNDEEPPEEPAKPLRLVTTDVTVEMLGELLGEHRNGADRGILVKRDEFSGWICSMDKYAAHTKGADRSVWLKAYDGGPYLIDRVARGEIYVPNLSVSFLAGIQPERMQELNGLTSDGLLQRFIPLMMVAPQKPHDIDVSEEAHKYEEFIYKMIGQRPRRFSFDNQAIGIVSDLTGKLFDIEQACGGFADGLQGFVGKLRGMVGTFALLLHCITYPDWPLQIDRSIALKAQRLVLDFIVKHGHEFYLQSPAGDHLRKVASWILTSGQKRLVVSDLTSNVVGFRGLSVPKINEQVSPLVAAGWLRPTVPALGFQNRSWDVNSRVFSFFAERAKAEAMRKTQIREFMSPTT